MTTDKRPRPTREAARMKLRRVPLGGLAAGERRLDGALFHYLGRVLRLRPGDAFLAFDPVAAVEAEALVLVQDRDALTVRISPLRAGESGASRRITWVQGSAKGDKSDAIVRDATELGAARVLIVRTHRSVVRLDAARAKARADRWTRVAAEAARQCGRAESPVVGAFGDWERALDAVDPGDARFCLSEQATAPLGPRLMEALGSGVSLAFACGPEGGLEESEVAAAERRGWKIVSLGPLILRTETVAAAVLGAVLVYGQVFPDRAARPGRGST